MLPIFAESMNLGEVSWFFIVHFIAVLFTRVITGRLPDRYLYYVVAYSMVFIAISLLGISFVHSTWQLFPVAFIFGMGYGAVYPALSAFVALNTPINFRGSALGIFTMSFDLGVSAGAIFAGLSTYLGFQMVYRILALVPVAGLIYFMLNFKHMISEEQQS